MPVQTSYQRNLPAGFPGLLWTTFEHSLRTTFIQAETTLEIPFGTFVRRITTTDELHKPKARLLTSSTDDIAGLVLHSHAYNRETDLGTVGLKPRTQLTVLEVGVAWAIAEEAMAMTDNIFVRYAAGTATTIGAIRNDADTSTAVRLKGARLLTPTIPVVLLGQSYLIAAVEVNMLTQKAVA